MTGEVKTAQEANRAAIFADVSAWCLFFFGLLLIKLFLFALDPLPKFYMGDSGSYLFTSVSRWVPEDRSYFYGYVIRWVALRAASLTPLLILQVFAATVIAFICGWICWRTLGLPRRIAFAFGILCSLDPLQLFWERAVMTETLSLFFYAILLERSFAYLRHRRLGNLVLIQVLGVLTIGFRMSYLVLVQALAVTLPLIAFVPLTRRWFLPRDRVLRLLLHLAIGVGVMLACHQTYKRLTGMLAHREPAYLHGTGLSLLSIWAPALRPEDSPDPILADLIRKGDRFHLREIDARPGQRFSPDGLVSSLLRAEPDVVRANKIAKETALNALKRNPFAIATIAAETYLEFWRGRAARRYAKMDVGAGYFTPSERAFVARRFHEVVPTGDLNKQRLSLTGRYYIRAWPYYLIILLSPLIVCITIGLRRALTRESLLLLWQLLLLLGSTMMFSIFPIVRYLHPLSLLTILALAIGVRLLIDRLPRKIPLIEQPIIL